MLVDNYINDIVTEFDKALEHLKEEYVKLQVGRATPAMIEDIQVEAYGTSQVLKGLATINVPDPKSLIIQPWDKSVLSSIEKAIQNSDLNLNPVNDGNVVRINIPPLTEERRQELTKLVSKLAEEAKVTLRHHRQDVLSKMRDLEKSKEISEDELRGGEKKLQDKVDDYNLKIDEMMKSKEKDVMTV